MAEEQRRGRRGGVDTAVRTSAVWDAVRRRGHPPLRRARPARSGARPRRRHRWPRRPARRARAPRHRRRPQPRRARRRSPAAPATPGSPTGSPRVQGDAATLLEVHRRPPTSTWSAATAPSRSSTTPPRRCAPSRPCSPTAATSACSSPSASPSSSPGPWPGSSPRPAHALTSDDGRWGAPTRCRAGSTRPASPRWCSEAGLTVQDSHGVRIFSDLVPAALIDSEADRPLLLELEQAASPPPRLRLPRPARCRTARPRASRLTGRRPTGPW